MARTIRQIGLTLFAALARLLSRPSAPGWSRSTRTTDLRRQ